MQYRIKKQTIVESPEMIIEANSQEELIIKYIDMLSNLEKPEESTKYTYLVTQMPDLEVSIREMSS